MSKSATKKSFLEFVNEFDNLGIVSKRTAENIQLAVAAVLKYIPDDKLATEWDIATIINSLRQDSELKEDTAKTYQSRFKSALVKFIDFTEGKALKPAPKRKSVTKVLEIVEEEIKTFSLPIPLRENLIVTIESLPRDLSEEEADRIATIIKSFAVK